MVQSGLELVRGVPPSGSTAQVGVINDKQLLVTLKTDPDPGTVDLVWPGRGPRDRSDSHGNLRTPGHPDAVRLCGTRDGTAVITLAHSSQDGLFRNGAFTSVVDAGQTADCWMTRVGKYVFTANTGSKTISRLIGTGSHVFVDSQVAAAIATGGAPADIDADAGVLSVISTALASLTCRCSVTTSSANSPRKGRRSRLAWPTRTAWRFSRWRPGSQLNAMHSRW